METNTFKLSKPITTHKGELVELVFKPPTASSFMKHGSPYTLSKDDVLTPDWNAVFGFLSDMTGIDTLLLSAVPAPDVMPLYNKLLGMIFVPPTNGPKPLEPSSSV